MSLLPGMFLPIDIFNIASTDVWLDFGDNASEWNFYPYRWNLEIQVTDQAHSSNATQTPYLYNGMDIAVDQWLVDGTGRCYKIIRVADVSPNYLTIEVEDVNQFNTINDNTSTGSGGPAAFYGGIFALDQTGQPDFRNITIGAFGAEIYEAARSRFTRYNSKSEYVFVSQTNHGLTVGDFIRVDVENEGRFELCAANEINVAVGIVTSVNAVQSDSFTFKPLTEILDNVQPPLVGAYGDIFYIDPENPGKVTNVKPLSDAKPVYIRLETENRAVRLNAIVDENSITVSFKVDTITLDQTSFTLPGEAKSVQVMSINGIENKNFTFDTTTKVLTFDPVATGYGVEETDEVIFVYNT